MEQSSKTERTPVIFLLKSLLFSYILTGALLVILAFLLYKLNLSEKIVSAAIIVIYVAATFFAGFMTGKKIRNRRFLWGLLEGAGTVCRRRHAGGNAELGVFLKNCFTNEVFVV